MASASVDLQIGPDLVIPASELSVRTSRSSGPGGQHVNTTDTRVQLRWDVGGSAVLTPEQRALLQERLMGRLSAAGELSVSCDSHRSQRRNLQEARVRLASLVLAALTVQRSRKPTARTRAGHERRLERKRRRAGVKRLRRQLPED